MKTLKQFVKESTEEPTHPLHRALTKLGMKHSVDKSPMEGDDTKIHMYTPKKKHDHETVHKALGTAGYKYDTKDRADDHSLHYYDHASGHTATVIVHNKTNKVAEVHSIKDDE